MYNTLNVAALRFSFSSFVKRHSCFLVPSTSTSFDCGASDGRAGGAAGGAAALLNSYQNIHTLAPHYLVVVVPAYTAGFTFLVLHRVARQNDVWCLRG